MSESAPPVDLSWPTSLRPTFEQLAYFANCIQKETGVIIGEKHYASLASRVAMFCRESEITIAEAITRHRRGDQKQIRDLVSALTNGETSFFRDRSVFDCLRDGVLPRLAMRREKTKQLRIWSAASSTGQEAYSVGMLVAEQPIFSDWSTRIYATDVAIDRNEKSRRGVYSAAEVARGLSSERRRKHTHPFGDGYQMAPHLRSMLQVSRLNLIEPWPQLPDMDIILLRNVIMYWSPEQRADVLARAMTKLAPDGFIILGSAEHWTQHADLLPPLWEGRIGIHAGELRD